MPLLSGYSRVTINENIARLIREGRSRENASAIAYRSARVSWRKRHPRGKFPDHLEPPRANPFPEHIRHDLIRDAARLFRDFTGEEGELVGELKNVQWPTVVAAFGTLDGVLYTTVRDGKTERYVHEFREKSKPLLCASPDGRMLVIVLGKYRFTDRGIVDK